MASTLGELAMASQGRLDGDPALPVEDVTHESTRVTTGVVFVAIRGSRFDGHEFVTAAAEAGAAGVCVETPIDVDVPQIVVDDTRAAIGPMASAVHGHPSRSLRVVGVTGTNGKTTVTHYVDSIVRSAGIASGLIGTVESRSGETSYDTVRTTPEASRLQRVLADMNSSGAEVVSMEVSSHALEMGRVRGTRFAVAAFTNLSQDHLDFHGTMAAYEAAKRSMFLDYEVEAAVVNVDDPVGIQIAEGFQGSLTTVGADGDVRAEDIVSSLSGSTFELSTPAGNARVSSPVLGGFNVDNLLLAIACCIQLDVPFQDVIAGTANLDAVPGRFELVSGDEGFAVFVDYAHTPEGIRSAIEVARGATGGNVIAVVGAGGNRDREKRPQMGVAAATADFAVITSDNPRDEEPGEIIAEVVEGLAADAPAFVVVEDRRSAIATALEMANDGDVVLILGKGHETGQEIAGSVIPFDDRAVARELLGIGDSATSSQPVSGSMSQ